MLERLHLRVVHVFEQHGSLAASANTLFLMQSALSHTVRKLEDNLGTPIYLRKGRRLRLAPTGGLRPRHHSINTVQPFQKAANR